MHNRHARLNIAHFFRSASYIALILMLVSLAGCGGTKVYSSDKTVVYKDAIYNVSDVKVFRPVTEAVLSETNTVDLRGVDKKRFTELLGQHGEILVRQGFMLDDQELVYQAQRVDSWSDFNRMNKRFQSASQDLTKFIGSAKKTQLKLK